MDTNDKNNVQQQTEAARQQAMNEAKENRSDTNKNRSDTNNDQTMHTINPFTGTKVDITPEELEGMEKFNEAQTECD